MKFFLGTHRPHWLWLTDVPLFVSHRTLRGRRSFQPATCDWALDSGGFTELSTYGRWVTSLSEYEDAIGRYREMGRLQFAAPMDWMCEPLITEKTGLSVREHQERTVQNYLDLKHIPEVIPVLQGWALEDYMACLSLYSAAGVDLKAKSLVGVGTVCRRQDTREGERIFRALNMEGLNLHGFGVKLTGLRRYHSALASSDSMSWSFTARRDRPLENCAHKACANCLTYALQWRERILHSLTEPNQEWLFV